ncbi:MAG: HEPN domain-containing protein [Candidatus Marinimicrobia bacterium]|nr:HEPN domain-containing protein [Candidatus Neomarinimicrobiota bacterium]
MKDETKSWLEYSFENMKSAKVLIENHLYNPCLQNVQQCVEKALKSLFIEYDIKLKKTHSISELKNILQNNKIEIKITEDECDFLDSVYLPSKYPMSGVLPYYEPDLDICEKGISIAEQIIDNVGNLLK